MMSYVDHDQGQPAMGAARVGAELQAARQRLGWNLADVAYSMRIRLPHLVAIEEGRVADLPGNAYAVGFVRTYATTLGLDPDEVSRRFRAEAHMVNHKTELSFPAPVPQRGVPPMAVILLGLLLAGGAYVGWLRYSGASEPVREQAATAPPERLAAMAPAVQMQSPQVASILPAPKPPQPVAAVPVAAALPPAPPSAPPVIAVPVPTPVPVAITSPTPVLPASAVPKGRVVLHAKTGGWVQVREKQGKVLLVGILHTGDSWPVPTTPNLLLTASNPSGLEVLVDGAPVPAVGPAGRLAHDVSLDPDALKAGPPKLPPPPRPVATPAAAPAVGAPDPAH